MNKRRLIVLAVLAVCACSVVAHAQYPDMFVSMRDSMLTDKTFPTIVEGLRHLNVDAIELNLAKDFSVAALDAKDRVFFKSDDDVVAYKKHADELGVRIWAVMTACDFSVNDPQANAAWMARAMEIAELLGAATVRVDSAMSKERELGFETRVQLMADGLGAALRQTKAARVTLGVENHGFQGNNLAFLLNVFAQAGSERLGSTLDTGNFYWRGYPLGEVYGIMRVLAPHAKHTHVKNINYPADQREVMREAGWEYGKYCCPFDEGDIDCAKVIRILADGGYKGDVCVEDESIGKCKTAEERVAVLERDVAHLRKILAGQ